MKDLRELKPICIIALNTECLVKERQILNDLGFTGLKRLNGVYKGDHEFSWLVVLEKEEDIVTLIELALEYKQDSILFSNSERETMLVHPDGRPHKYIGTLKNTDRTEAHKHDGYTFDPETGMYWVAS